jgi:hypothetical protein
MSTGRIVVPGSRADGGGDAELVAIQESTGSWVVYPLNGQFGVRLSAATMLGLAHSIMLRAGWSWYPPATRENRHQAIDQRST